MKKSMFPSLRKRKSQVDESAAKLSPRTFLKNRSVGRLGRFMSNFAIDLYGHDDFLDVSENNSMKNSSDHVTGDTSPFDDEFKALLKLGGKETLGMFLKQKGVRKTLRGFMMKQKNEHLLDFWIAVSNLHKSSMDDRIKTLTIMQILERFIASKSQKVLPFEEDKVPLIELYQCERKKLEEDPTHVLAVGRDIFDVLQEKSLQFIAETVFPQFIETEDFSAVIEETISTDSNSEFSNLIENLKGLYIEDCRWTRLFLTIWSFVPFPIAIIERRFQNPQVFLSNSPFKQRFEDGFILQGHQEWSTPIDCIALDSNRFIQIKTEEECICFKSFCAAFSLDQFMLLAYIPFAIADEFATVMKKTPWFVTLEQRDPSDATLLWLEEKSNALVPLSKSLLLANPETSLGSLLRYPSFRDTFQKYLGEMNSSNNLIFWKRVELFKNYSGDHIDTEARAIFNEFLSSEAATPVSIYPLHKKYHTMFSRSEKEIAITSSIFSEAQSYSVGVMAKNFFNDFFKSSYLPTFVHDFSTTKFPSAAVEALNASTLTAFRSGEGWNPWMRLFLATLEVLDVPLGIFEARGDVDVLAYATKGLSELLEMPRLQLLGKGLEYLFPDTNLKRVDRAFRLKDLNNVHILRLGETKTASLLCKSLLLSDRLQEFVIVLVSDIEPDESTSKVLCQIRKSMSKLPFFVPASVKLERPLVLGQLDTLMYVEFLRKIFVAERISVLPRLLQYPVFLEPFSQHLRDIYAEENIDFHKAVEEFKCREFDKMSDRQRHALKIFNTFISEHSKDCVNITFSVRQQCEQIFSDPENIPDIDETVFDSPQDHVISLMANSCLPDFVTSSKFDKLLPDLASIHQYSPVVDALGSSLRDVLGMEAEPWLRLFLGSWEVIPYNMCTIDTKSSVVLHMNQKFGSVLGFHRRELIARPLALHSAFQEAVALSEERCDVFHEVQGVGIASKDGEELNFDILMKTVFISSKLRKITFLLLFLTDELKDKNRIHIFRKCFSMLPYFVCLGRAPNALIVKGAKEWAPFCKRYILLSSKYCFAALLHYKVFREEFRKFLTRASVEYYLDFWTDCWEFKHSVFDGMQSYVRFAKKIFLKYFNSASKLYLNLKRFRKPMEVILNSKKEASIINACFFDECSMDIFETMWLNMFQRFITETDHFDFIAPFLASLEVYSPTADVMASAYPEKLHPVHDSWLNLILATFEISPYEMVLFDPSDSNIVIYASKGFCEHLGYKRGSVVGRCIEDFVKSSQVLEESAFPFKIDTVEFLTDPSKHYQALVKALECFAFVPSIAQYSPDSKPLQMVVFIDFSKSGSETLMETVFDSMTESIECPWSNNHSISTASRTDRSIGLTQTLN